MSEGVDALIIEAGFEGYGRWNRLLEIVASKMDETDRCHVEYSVQKWCELLGFYHRKSLESFFDLTAMYLKCTVNVRSMLNKSKGDVILISIPNLLKKRDNYTKHLQVESKRLQSIDIEVDKEVEVDIKKTKKTPFSFSDIWNKYPSKDGKKNAEKHFDITVKIEEDWKNINQALDNYLKHLSLNTWKKPQAGKTWFNNWHDWINWEEPKEVNKEEARQQALLDSL